MEPIRNLQGLGGTFPSSDRIVSPAVAANDLRAGMSGEPLRYSVGTAVGQQIHGAVSVQVDQNGAIAAATSEREVVNTQGARGRSAGEELGADTGQQDGRRGAQPQCLEEASPRRTTGSEPNSGKPLIQPLGPTCIGPDQLREPFRKDLAGTLGSITGVSQKNLRVCSTSFMAMPCQGRSARRRV